MHKIRIKKIVCFKFGALKECKVCENVACLPIRLPSPWLV